MGPTRACSTGARTISVRSLAAASPSVTASSAAVVKSQEPRARTGDVDRQRRDGRQHGDQQERLGGKREIERNARPEQHRQPQEPAVVLGFEALGEAAGERQRRPVQGETTGIGWLGSAEPAPLASPAPSKAYTPTQHTEHISGKRELARARLHPASGRTKARCTSSLGRKFPV